MTIYLCLAGFFILLVIFIWRFISSRNAISKIRLAFFLVSYVSFAIGIMVGIVITLVFLYNSITGEPTIKYEHEDNIYAYSVNVEC